MEIETLGYTLSETQALVDKLADFAAEVEEETIGDTLSDAQELLDTLVDFKHRCRQRRQVTG